MVSILPAWYDRYNTDDIISAFYTHAIEMDRPAWVMDKATFIHLMILKDAQGRYIFGEPVPTIPVELKLMGLPVIIDEEYEYIALENRDAGCLDWTCPSCGKINNINQRACGAGEWNGCGGARV